MTEPRPPEVAPPLRVQIAYASGMLGWSVMTNIITVMLIYFYLPPNNSGLQSLVPQVAVFGFFTILSLIAASGRLFDAFTDPLIAYWSDRSDNPKGRRLPFMTIALVPAVLFCILIFLPFDRQESMANVWWLLITQSGFYLFLTAYIIPYNALLPELAISSKAKVRLSTWLSFAFVLGVIISSQTPGLADLFQYTFPATPRDDAFQWAIAALSVLAGFFMLVPILVINEKNYSRSKPITLPLFVAFRQILTNRNFLIFILADFSYFVSLTIITSSMLYILRVLLGLPEAFGGLVMGLLVVVSLLFYPIVGRLVQHFGKKPLIQFSLFFQGVLLWGIYFMGKLPLDPKVQIFGFAVLCAAPAAFLGILPFAIIAEIAENDTQRTGQHKEAMYFAVRNFSVKLGQTLGIMTFATLTLLGKDPGHDMGIRLAGVFGSVLCITAGLVFYRFKETAQYL